MGLYIYATLLVATIKSTLLLAFWCLLAAVTLLTTYRENNIMNYLQKFVGPQLFAGHNNHRHGRQTHKTVAKHILRYIIRTREKSRQIEAGHYGRENPP